jgi:hypothetical protein
MRALWLKRARFLLTSDPVFDVDDYVFSLFRETKVVPFLCGAFAGTLQISSSEEEDLGKYECIAQNNVGTEYSQPTMLYVKGKAIARETNNAPRRTPNAGKTNNERTGCEGKRGQHSMALHVNKSSVLRASLA